MQHHWPVSFQSSPNLFPKHPNLSRVILGSESSISDKGMHKESSCILIFSNVIKQSQPLPRHLYNIFGHIQKKQPGKLCCPWEIRPPIWNQCIGWEKHWNHLTSLNTLSWFFFALRDPMYFSLDNWGYRIYRKYQNVKSKSCSEMVSTCVYIILYIYIYTYLYAPQWSEVVKYKLAKSIMT